MHAFNFRSSNGPEPGLGPLYILIPGHTQCKGASRCKCRCKPQTLHPHLDAIKLLASASAVMQMQLSEPASASAVMQMQIELHLRCASIRCRGPGRGPGCPTLGPGAQPHIFFGASGGEHGACLRGWSIVWALATQELVLVYSSWEPK